MKTAFLSTALIVCASFAFAEGSLGVTSMIVNDAAGERPLNVSLWYQGSGGTQQNFGSNAVFEGVRAGGDASFTGGPLPVVLVSHGGLRSSDDSGAWLSAELAKAGFLAVEVNGPRPETAADAVNEIWQRSNDVSLALTAILNDTVWADRVDPSRISVVGFALGGTAALALSGGELDPQAFVQSCSTPSEEPDCAWYDAQDVAMDSVNMRELIEPRDDRRISTVVAISPEYAGVFSDDLPSIKVPALLVSLGSEIPLEASNQTEIIARLTLPTASMFDAFSVCTPAGPEILVEDGGDPALCGVSVEERQRVHDSIATQIVDFLGER
mgnify:CR=1 FL=1